jgi:hypothetical protein
MQGNNVLVMPPHTASPNPEDVSSVWRAVHKLEKEFESLLKTINRPSRWRKFWLWIWKERNWTIVTGLALLGGLGSGIFTLGGMLLNKHVEAGLSPLQKDIRRIDDSISHIEGELGGIQLNHLSATPASPQSISEAGKILRTARTDKLQLDNQAIADSGKRFLEATKGNPDAWNTVLEFLNYRAYLNTVTVSLGPQEPLAKPAETRYAVSKDNIPTMLSMSTIGISKSADAPVLRNLSDPDLNDNLPTGPSLLVVRAPTIILDNLYVKKIVIVDSHIIYRGGAVVLDSVYFLNCTFEIEREPRGEQLAESILSGNATSFIPS